MRDAGGMRDPHELDVTGPAAAGAMHSDSKGDVHVCLGLDKGEPPALLSCYRA